ncbi:hypothetical protein NQ176_g5709 [Zarea fungicola]|uniref:Uncharacterized protein n=1 Tax=Zarea fungicola TaxID=93591 RepID=A0ACC1N8Z8_9HYPO|nr:hypothetical protein NQ176_g5709 [Lecanicillium fungicola]
MEFTDFQSGQGRTYSEMRQKPAPRDTFFNLINNSQQCRPMSVATEFVDTDWDEEETILTDVEDNSPRVSVQSSGQTTLDSFGEEALTPRSSRLENYSKQIEGPVGPHLFRISSDSEDYYVHKDTMGMSPITPKPHGFGEIMVHPPLPLPHFAEITVQSPLPLDGPFQYTKEELDTSDLVSWTPEMVAQAMLDAGIEISMADRFIENDINGPILITLKSTVSATCKSGLLTPGLQPRSTDAPSREVRREARKQDEPGLKRRASSRRKRRATTNADDNIMPSESVSIIGIEQVIPKPHHCSKGENCSKWRKQQRLLEDFKRANPHVDMKASGKVMIYGDVGNPETARAINPNDDLRPFSDAAPSLVASSDILGTDEPG